MDVDLSKFIFLLVFLLPVLGRLVEGLAKLFTRSTSGQETARRAPQPPPESPGTPVAPSPLEETLRDLFDIELRPEQEQETEVEEPPAPPPVRPPPARRRPVPPAITRMAPAPDVSWSSTEGAVGELPALPTSRVGSAAPLRGLGSSLDDEDDTIARAPLAPIGDIQGEVAASVSEGPALRVGEPRDWRRAIVLYELLGPPAALRSPGTASWEDPPGLR